MKIIAAVDEKWGIGRNGSLLFHLPSDMKFFKETTMGKIVVMGRKTLDSFPGGKPLSGRVNLVLTRNKKFSAEGARVLHTKEKLLAEIEKYKSDDVFVIGGGEIYKMLLPYCDTAYITKIFADGGAEVFLPNLDKSVKWSNERVSERRRENGVEFEFRRYVRIASEEY